MEAAKDRNLKALVLYWSATRNTEKVARTIHERLEKENVTSTLLKLADAGKEDFYTYDLVLIGAPAYQFNAPDPVIRFVKEKMRFHNERGDIKLTAPKIPGKTAAVFCTYSGPHTGIREAVPVIKYLGQFFEHLGFTVAGEWYVVGEFHNRQDASTKGVLGDVRGRPGAEDLAEVEDKVSELVRSIRAGTISDVLRSAV